MTADQARRRIRNAWIAGLVAASTTLVASLMPLFGVALAGFNLWNLTDFALIAGLTFGISRRSRVCALVMLAYFVISKVSLVARTNDIAGAVLDAILAYLFFEGVRGAFASHQLAKARAPEPPVLAS